MFHEKKKEIKKIIKQQAKWQPYQWYHEKNSNNTINLQYHSVDLTEKIQLRFWDKIHLQESEIKVRPKD